MINHFFFKKKQYKFDYTYILLVLTVIWQWCIIFNKEKEQNNLKIELTRKEQILSLLNGNCKLHYTYSEKQLSEFTLIDRIGQKIKFTTFIGDKDMIILKYSPNNCSSCIQFCLSLIERLGSITSYNNVAIIINDTTEREFHKISGILPPEIPLYMTDDSVFDDILSIENIPYIFLADSSLQLKDLFIPMKEIPAHADTYIRLMQKKYFSDNTTTAMEQLRQQPWNNCDNNHGTTVTTTMERL